MEKIPHIPVLFTQTIDAFKELESGYILDCTLGYGGHTKGLLEKYQNINLICNDQDQEALQFSKKLLNKYKNRIIFNNDNFQTVIDKYKSYDIKGILADVGISSLQLDKVNRGFGFNSDTLDMRMNQKQELQASHVVNEYSKLKLEDILKRYGEVKEYKKVASLIIQNRPFRTSRELALMLNKNMHKGKIHPATLPFQAIRIEVNKELESLENLCKNIENAKLSKCIVAIISFHSLEDRIVKSYFRKWSKNCICPEYLDKCECGNSNKKGKIITKKPIIPLDNEIKFNPRSRSAKLRIFRFE